MNDPRVLNHFGVVLRLADWKTRSSGLQSALVNDILHRATSVGLSRLRLDAIQHGLKDRAAAYLAETPVNEDKMAFSSPIVPQFVSEVTASLAALKTIQNAAIPLAHAACGRGRRPPSSLTQASAHLSDYGFPDGFAQAASHYWTTWGKRLQEYRDLDQHYMALIKQTFLQVRPEPRLRMLLPDNPHAHNPTQHTYTGQVDGQEFLEHASTACFSFLDDLARLAGYEPKPHQINLTRPSWGTVSPAFIGFWG